MGGNLGPQITEGIRRGQMQNNPMPPGQQGPASPFGMIPEFKFDPEKGLNVTLSPEHLQQLFTAGMGLMKNQGPAAQPGQQQGMGQQPMAQMPIPQNYRRM